jgi:hypothetical protein
MSLTYFVSNTGRMNEQVNPIAHRLGTVTDTNHARKAQEWPAAHDPQDTSRCLNDDQGGPQCTNVTE